MNTNHFITSHVTLNNKTIESILFIYYYVSNLPIEIYNENGRFIMELGFNLSQKQTLKLALSPELQQSINILKYSSIELLDFLYEQANENPFLELTEKNSYFPKSINLSNREDRFNSHKLRSGTNISFDHEYYNPIQNYSPNTETLERHLMEQMNMLNHLTKLQQDILEFLIGNLNEQGYLEIEANIVAQIFSIPLIQVEDIISVLQSLDPIGVGAKNLTDCLLIQLRARSDVKELVYLIVENHLTDIAEKRYRKLARLYEKTLQEVQTAVDYIRTLNPRSASHFHTEMTSYISPDVIVERVEGEYIIIVNDSVISSLSINSYYKKMIQNKHSETTQHFLKDKFNEATLYS